MINTCNISNIISFTTGGPFIRYVLVNIMIRNPEKHLHKMKGQGFEGLNFGLQQTA